MLSAVAALSLFIVGFFTPNYGVFCKRDDYIRHKRVSHTQMAYEILKHTYTPSNQLRSLVVCCVCVAAHELRRKIEEAGQVHGFLRCRLQGAQQAVDCSQLNVASSAVLPILKV